MRYYSRYVNKATKLHRFSCSTNYTISILFFAGYYVADVVAVAYIDIVVQQQEKIMANYA